MIITSEFKEIIETSTAKALATVGVGGVNVVPVSVVKVEDDRIFLYDFFMKKTVENVKGNSEVALVVWTGLAGIQIKGHMRYQSTGELFSSEEKVMKGKFPDRTLRGVLILEPTEIYDVSADTAKAGMKLG